MGLASIYLGNQTWEDFISDRQSIASFEKAVEQQTGLVDESLAIPGAIRVALSQRDYHIAIESGLGALGSGMTYGIDDSNYSIEFGFDQLPGGIDLLKADL